MQMSLKAHRINAGLTQQEVADRLDISRHTIITIESEEVIPKAHYLYALAYLYKVSIDNIRIATKV